MGVVRDCLAAIESHLAPGGVALVQLGPDGQAQTAADMLEETKLVAGETRDFGERGVLLRIDHRG
jgi:release factor glutamine methyltransferase